MRMIFLLMMESPLSACWSLKGCGSDDPAIGAQRLTVDPGAVRACEEGHRVGDILRVAETFQRRQLGQTVDYLLRLAVEEELGRRRPGRDGVDGDVPAAQLLGENARHGLDRRLGGGIDAVSRLQPKC